MSTSVDAVSKLFLSCDLTGSTAFKQWPGHNPQAPWQKAFLQFYWEFPETLATVKSRALYDHAAGLEFELWKPIGDELLFTCDVQSEFDVWTAIQIWKDTLAEYQNVSLSDEALHLGQRPRLGVKGGAFIGTFPGPDSACCLPRQPGGRPSGPDVIELNRKALASERDRAKYHYDYFGPSIDTGFRILSQSTARYFTLSVEVAFVLAVLHKHDGPKPCRTQDMVLLDGTELKGVWGGRRYPLFALDLHAEQAINKAFAQYDSARQDPQAATQLCQACYTSDGWPFKVYFPKGLSGGYFLDPPSDPLDGYIPFSEQEAVAHDTTEGSGELVATAPVS